MNELNNLLNNRIITDFIQTPCETSNKVDNTLMNILKFIFTNVNIYCSEYIFATEEDVKNITLGMILSTYFRIAIQ